MDKRWVDHSGYSDDPLAHALGLEKEIQSESSWEIFPFQGSEGISLSGRARSRFNGQPPDKQGPMAGAEPWIDADFHFQSELYEHPLLSVSFKVHLPMPFFEAAWELCNAALASPTTLIGLNCEINHSSELHNLKGTNGGYISATGRFTFFLCPEKPPRPSKEAEK